MYIYIYQLYIGCDFVWSGTGSCSAIPLLLGHQSPFFFTSASGTNRSAPYLAVETGHALQGGYKPSCPSASNLK